MASDQLTPGSFNHKYATIGKYQYHYVEEGNPFGLPVVLVHGFPDLWFGWRHQIRFLASQHGPQGQGYRVIAVDLLGYGATSKPQSADGSGDAHPDYSPKTVAGHVVALMDQLGIAKAVVVGHDWGCGITSRIGWHFPEKVFAQICVGNPQRPVTKDFISLDELEKENHMFSYFKYFASAQAIHDMDTGMDDYIGAVFCDSTGNNEEDRKYYIDNLRPEGFHGPLSYYRTFRMSHREDLPMVGKRYTIPTLLMVVIEDLILVPEYVRSVNLDYVDKLEYLDIETGGHFVLTENPDAVNQGIKNYIEKLFGAGEIAKENEKVVAEVAKEEMKEVKEEELEEEKEVRNREQAIEVLELNDALGAEGPSYSSSSSRVTSIKHFSHGHEHGPVLLESGERSKKAKL